MAKVAPGTKIVKYPYPTRFGSHKTMIVGDPVGGRCTCQDEFGQYNTELCRLDTGLADPNRYSDEREISKKLRGN